MCKWHHAVFLSLSDLFHLAQCLQGLSVILHMTGYPHFYDFIVLHCIHTATALLANQFSSVAHLCLTLCNPMDGSAPGFPVYLQLPELAQTQVYWVSDAIQPPQPLLAASPPALDLPQPQGLFQWCTLRLLLYLGYCKWCSNKHGVQMSFQDSVFVSFGYVPRSWMAGSYGSFTYNFSRILHTVFHNGRTNLQPQQRCTRVLFSPHSHQCLLPVVFFWWPF